jgi:hypothetical protein
MKGVKVGAKKIDEQQIVALFRRRKKSVFFPRFFPDSDSAFSLFIR